METEEHEQIPWSHLVAEAEQPVDKRIYTVVGVVAVVALAFIGLRFFPSGSPAPPTAAEAAPFVNGAVDPPVSHPATEAIPEGFATPTTVGAISEADLMADLPADAPGTAVAAFIAEWFVTDFYTRDGSPETAASLSDRIDPALRPELPVHVDDSPTSFVEWAEAFRVEDIGSEWVVSVGYRTVTEVDAGFVRDPVGAVRLSVVPTDGGWIVASLPALIDLP